MTFILYQIFPTVQLRAFATYVGSQQKEDDKIHPLFTFVFDFSKP